MRSFAALLALLLWATSAMAVKCDLPELESVDQADAPCLFYMGTKHFREKNYASAVASWRQLLEASNLPVEYEHYQVDAYNNLGYMHFMGWGVTEDRKMASRYWAYAYKAGHEESAYHLCHFYGSPHEPEYKPRVAIGYCKEALRRYEQRKSELAENAEVVRQLKRYIASLAVQ
jgi:TPR repeat protein